MQTALTGTFRQSPFWQLRALFRERGLLDSEVCCCRWDAAPALEPPYARRDAVAVQRDLQDLCCA